MAKIKVDTTGVEVNPPAVKPGLYQAKIKEAEAKPAKSSGNMQLAIIYEIVGGEFDGRVLFDYIPLDDDSMAFRLAAFQDALGMKRKGEIDTDKLVGKKIAIRTVVQKSEEYGEQARVRNVLPPKGAAKADDIDEDDGDDDDEDVDYEEMTLEELKEELEARELEVEGKQTKKKLIAALEEHDEEEEDDADDDDDEDDEGEAEESDDDDDEDDEEDEEDDDEDEEAEDYSEMDLAELKAAAKEKKLKTKGLKKKQIIELLEEEDEDEEPDYSEMDIDELKNEAKERGLKSTGKKDQLISRLEKDDKTGDDGEPF